MTATNPKVDFYFLKNTRWQPELAQLRTIMLNGGLTEELKWGVPCYLFESKNLVLIHVFKAYCAVLFFKGALLQDTAGVLVQQTENVQAARQLRFTQVQEIKALEPILKAYIYEAIEVEKLNLKVDLKKTAAFARPIEFEKKLAETPALKTAFEALTPGRQRAYLLYFAAPKQAKTRLARVEKCSPQILQGKGLNDE
ncbi:YdeI/OmpD-associated family protein [Adhaeribacter pallidiroseus]|uniref:YdhG-like domain-containing protein n=1 Tax=Adhaeribacter pallidiroseus TaxID=2072847 RepID=A0A369QMJ7_9BACT|nr:DUF1801 domain-containing protein [Adhaeribacter pallidiroseus]RDC65570.1 uncharacterized protein AHMF7616_04200 [Adhaeribacter pallidiroseus]